MPAAVAAWKSGAVARWCSQQDYTHEEGVEHCRLPFFLILLNDPYGVQGVCAVLFSFRVCVWCSVCVCVTLLFAWCPTGLTSMSFRQFLTLSLHCVVCMPPALLVSPCAACRVWQHWGEVSQRSRDMFGGPGVLPS